MPKVKRVKTQWRRTGADRCMLFLTIGCELFQRDGSRMNSTFYSDCLSPLGKVEGRED